MIGALTATRLSNSTTTRRSASYRCRLLPPYVASQFEPTPTARPSHHVWVATSTVLAADTPWRAYSEQGEFVGLVAYLPREGCLKAVRLMNTAAD